MQLINTTSNVTMSSLEMVEFINGQRGADDAQIRHRDFTTKVPKVLGAETSEKFRTSFKDAYGREQPGYNFPKREACLMAMSYSYDLQAKVFDRMTELESKSDNQPKTRLQLAKENVLLIEEIEAKEALLLAQAPAVEYVERFVKAEGLIGVREAAKSLGLNQNAFVNMLIGSQVMFRENGHLQAYAPDIAAGRFLVKAELDASGKARPSTKFTSKGLRWVAGKLKLDQLFNE